MPACPAGRGRAGGPGFGADPVAHSRLLNVGLVVNDAHREQQEQQLVPATVVPFRRGQLVEYFEQPPTLIIRKVINVGGNPLLKLDRHVRVDLVVARVQPPPQVNEQTRDARQHGGIRVAGSGAASIRVPGAEAANGPGTISPRRIPQRSALRSRSDPSGLV